MVLRLASATGIVLAPTINGLFNEVSNEEIRTQKVAPGHG